MPQPQTYGQYLIYSALPEKMREEYAGKTIDKKTLGNLMSKLALDHPNEYGDVIKKLNDAGVAAQTERGGLSPSIGHFKESKAWKEKRDTVRQWIQQVYKNPNLSPDEKKSAVQSGLIELSKQLQKEVFSEITESNNPLAHIIISGTKGSPGNASNLLASALQYTDPNGNIVPIPVMNSYSKGLRPSEYWAASYGTRRGVVDTKKGTADAGYVGKQLVQIASRGVVTGEDDPDNLQDELRGLPVDVDDDDNIGSLLARSTGGYKRNTIITAKVLRDLKKSGVKRMLVRSPIVGGPQDGSLYAKDVGLREQGRLPVLGENPGVVGANSLSEILSQGNLSSKHSAGVVGSTAGAVSGFKAINQLLQVPKESVNWAAHSDSDGVVQSVKEAPQGGHFVFINNKPVYVPAGAEVKVKSGDEVEAGDILSGGLPNPSMVVKHKGIGEGRRYFTDVLTKTMRDSGMNVNRRNVELIARGIVNHMVLDDELDNYVQGDKVPYNMLEKYYEPRKDAKETSAELALGQYLEKPVLHYTIGTKIRPSVVKELREFGVADKVLVHKEPPPFHPEMVRGAAVAQHDPDWIASMQGSGIKSRLLQAVHRGHNSNPYGTNYVAGIVGDPNFAGKGTKGKIVSPLYQLDEMQKKRQEAPVNPFDLDDDDD